MSTVKVPLLRLILNVPHVSFGSSGLGGVAA